MADEREPFSNRPRSPDLQVYRPTLTMIMSIAHRITGAALYLGMVLFVWWLIAVASGSAGYAVEQQFMRSLPGLVILFGFTWAALHHTLGGVRHLIWDTGFAHDYPWREYLAQATIVGSLSLTIILWIVGYLI
jgi:succinate dehydrogenase / fumarate reductase cytochrome b subunit